jgi:Uma2 family endonuclease
MATTSVNLNLQSGQNLTISPINWVGFLEFLEELPSQRSSRITYANQTLEVMIPLPEHERSKIILADLVKTLLRLQKRPWEPLGSTTFKQEQKGMGVEPDECFYIDNYQAVIGKDRLDLSVDPPPDLAIEIDITSQTKQNVYLALGVPELWIYYEGKLRIYILRESKYELSDRSQIFPELDIAEIFPRLIDRAKVIGVSEMLREFEELWLL